MQLTHFHARGRDAPLRVRQVELRPFRVPQLARPHEHQRRELERKCRHRVPAVAIDRRVSSTTRAGSVTDAKFWDLTGASASFKSAATSCWGTPRRHRESKHTSCEGANAMRGFVAAACLDAAQSRQRLLGSNRYVAKRRYWRLRSESKDACKLLSAGH
jgi:hypothetical protein